MAGHVYRSVFFDYIGEGSRASARVIVPLLAANVEMRSVVDVGAGTGVWAAEWLEVGIEDVRAVDGVYVDMNQLQVPQEIFQRHDLTQPLHLTRRFDVAQSLEVAEHLAPEHASTFVETLVSLADVILFSAAVPFQGGEHHVNEQPPEYWRQKFAAHGYICFDWLRPLIATRRDVKPWYRFNSLLYANRAGQTRLSEAVRASRVPDTTPVAMRGDFGWLARRAAVALIPKLAVNLVAQAKAATETRILRLRRSG
jgi:hypothetical protein